MKAQKKLVALIYPKKVAVTTAKEFEEFREELSKMILTR